MEPEDLAKVSLVDLLLAFIGGHGSPVAIKRISNDLYFAKQRKSSMRSALYRLEKTNLVTRIGRKWLITEAGKQHIGRIKLLEYIASPFTKNEPEKILVAFDIPERLRKERNWLRSQLKIFEYKMVQRSLWVGPGPLPEEFIKRLKDLQIDKDTMMFELAHRNDN